MRAEPPVAFDVGSGTAEVEVRPYRELWCAVLLAMLADAAEDDRRFNNPDRAYEVRQAKNWIGSRDFFSVCDLAGVDGRAVLERLRANGVA